MGLFKLVGACSTCCEHAKSGHCVRELEARALSSLPAPPLDRLDRYCVGAAETLKKRDQAIFETEILRSHSIVTVIAMYYSYSY